MLMQLGSIQFEVAPFNTDGYERESRADHVAKDVMGGMRPREFMGEGDESMSIGGRLFPHKFGGLSGLDALDAMRRSGSPQILVRGDGRNLGWFVIESVRERSSYLDAQGIGRLVEFDIQLSRAPAPSAASYVTQFLRLFLS